MGLDDERAHLIDNVPSYQDAVSAPPYSHSSQRKLLEFTFLTVNLLIAFKSILNNP